jgi:phosphoribosyl 1,2-cyclic phosphodiesterase
MRDALAMRAYFCGTRGSTPVSGAGQLHYGGHTSCIALAHSGEPPTIVLDAGTGLQQLSLVLHGEPFRGSLLLSHLHWDHTHGMPFFRSGALPGSRVDVYLPEQGVEPEELLARAISPPHFPIRPKQLGDGWTFNAIEPGHYEFEGFSVDALEIPHKGGRTFGYRLSDGSGTLAYLPDHNPISLGPGPDGIGVFHDAAVMLSEDADLLVHDSQHTAAELPRLAFLGHSAVEYAVALAQRANARQFALFHHDPWRTDAEIDALVAQYAAAPVRVFAAHDGMVVNLPLPIRIGRGVCDKPPGHERVGFRAAHAVAGDRDEERLPIQGQGAQRLVRDDRRRARDAAQQRDLPEAVARGERRAWLSPHADRGGSGDDHVEQLTDFPLTHRHRARRELMRLEIAGQKLDHRQRQGREHGQPPEQFHLLPRSGHGLVESHETPDVGQSQDR